MDVHCQVASDRATLDDFPSLADVGGGIGGMGGLSERNCGKLEKKSAQGRLRHQTGEGQMNSRFCVVVFGFLGLAVMGMDGAAAAEDFYKDKTVRIVVGSAAGGGYDSVARVTQRYLPKYIPGNPNMIVVNMPGGSGLTAANHLATIAEKDGTVIGVANRFAPMAAVLGSDQAKFKAEQFQWIGTTASYADNAHLLVIRSALPYKNADDLRKTDKPIFIAQSGSDVPPVLKEALHFNIKIVAGYQGSDDVELAFERGEVDGHTSGYDSILGRHPTWFPSGFIRTILQFGRIDRLAVLSDIPTARELATTQEDRTLIEFAELPLLIARPLLAPPEVPKERVELLRAAFMKMVQDPGYLEESKKLKLEVTPLSGAEVQKIIKTMTNAPAAVRSRYLKALDGKMPS